MIPKRVRDEMNVQVKHELESYYLYLSMVAWFHANNLDGMAHWMRVQAHEEMIHAMKFFDHIIERGGGVELLDLKQGKTSWASALEAWKDAYAHEQYISERIRTITKVVREEADFTAEPLCAWFNNEQIEEESSTAKGAASGLNYIPSALLTQGSDGLGSLTFRTDDLTPPAIEERVRAVVIAPARRTVRCRSSAAACPGRAG